MMRKRRFLLITNPSYPGHTVRLPVHMSLGVVPARFESFIAITARRRAAYRTYRTPQPRTMLNLLSTTKCPAMLSRRPQRHMGVRQSFRRRARAGKLSLGGVVATAIQNFLMLPWPRPQLSFDRSVYGCLGSEWRQHYTGASQKSLSWSTWPASVSLSDKSIVNHP
jgi:hypothetical protein